MGWRERDYSQWSWREPGGRADWRSRLPPPAAAGLLVVLAVAYIAFLIMRAETGTQLEPWIRLYGQTRATLENPALAETAVDAPRGCTPLAVLLHPLASERVLSLLLAMLTVWILGGMIEQRIGAARMLTYFWVGCVMAGAGYFVTARFAPDMAVLPLDDPVGAFAAWCVACWFAFRWDPIDVLGRTFPLSGVIATCALISVGLTLFLFGFAAFAWLVAVVCGGAAAPLVEALARVIAVRSQRLAARRAPTPRAPRQPVRASLPPRESLAPSADEAEIDEILAKISREGLPALTADERRRLEAARQAMLRGPRRDDPED